MKFNEDHLNLLRKLTNDSSLTQRKLAAEMGFSLGKLNYCLKELKKKGFIKINNFTQNQNKVNYIYILTPKGIVEKTKLTLEFVKRKMKEYDDIKKEASKIYKKRKNI
jgi:EPS-associated MarR family transcriptional regulator